MCKSLVQFNRKLLFKTESLARSLAEKVGARRKESTFPREKLPSLFCWGQFRPCEASSFSQFCFNCITLDWTIPCCTLLWATLSPSSPKLPFSSTHSHLSSSFDRPQARYHTELQLGQAPRTTHQRASFRINLCLTYQDRGSIALHSSCNCWLFRQSSVLDRRIWKSLLQYSYALV